MAPERDVPDSEMIIPARYPELTFLLWNRDPERPMSPREAFAVYERHWRFVDAARMGEEERAFLERLIARYGQGVFLA